MDEIIVGMVPVLAPGVENVSVSDGEGADILERNLRV